VRDRQVVVEGPVDKTLVAQRLEGRRQDAGRDPGHKVLDPQHQLELPAVGGAEGAVAGERRLLGLAPADHVRQLAAGGDAEVEGCADALGGQRQAVAGRIAGEEDAVVGGFADTVRDPVALVANRLAVQVVRQLDGRVLDVEAGVEGADPDTHLVVGGEAPAVAGGDVAAVDPDLEVVAAAGGMHLQAA